MKHMRTNAKQTIYNKDKFNAPLQLSSVIPNKIKSRLITALIIWPHQKKKENTVTYISVCFI